MGVEALGLVDGKLGTAEEALEQSHQVVMAQRAQVAALAETKANLVQHHGPTGRCRLRSLKMRNIRHVVRPPHFMVGSAFSGTRCAGKDPRSMREVRTAARKGSP